MTLQQLKKEALFEAIWKAIKGWDIERSEGEGYAHTTGDDVRTIIKAISPLITKAYEQGFEEGKKSNS